MPQTLAYVLIEALPGKAIELASILSKVEGMKSVNVVTGPFDVISLVEAPNLKALGELIVKKIQATNRVAKTLTCIVVET